VISMYGRCKHGRVSDDGCPACEARMAYEKAMAELFPGLKWDDLTDEERQEVESEVEHGA
jgi:hypothetical protein